MSTATSSAQHAQRHPLETLGRVGYGVKGVLYALLGVIALDAAVGSGDPEGQDGAFATLAQQSYGEVLLWILVVGLAAYALWRVVLAVTDPEGEGDDIEGAGKRVFYVVSAFAYGSLAFSAYRIVTGSGQGGSGGGTEERAQTLLGLPGGRWIVGLLALALLGYGVYQFVRAYRASFMSNFHLDQRAVQRRDLIKRAGQWGLSSRGVVYVLTGVFMAQAALRADADEAGGLDQALGTLQQQSYGPWLLGLVAIGFVMYGVYCWVNMRYRRYEGQ
jgi:hypothetical protein